MSTTIIRPKDRAEWLEYRKDGIGSSEVATILGLNPWETPFYQLWRRKKGWTPPSDETFAMKAGHYLEDAVSQFWADATGRTERGHQKFSRRLAVQEQCLGNLRVKYTEELIPTKIFNKKHKLSPDRTTLGIGFSRIRHRHCLDNQQR